MAANIPPGGAGYGLLLTGAAAAAGAAALLLSSSSRAASGGGGGEPALRAELQAMRLKALQARAAAAGVTEDSIDDALEADAPKAALVTLIILQSAASQGGPAGVFALRWRREGRREGLTRRPSWCRSSVACA